MTRMPPPLSALPGHAARWLREQRGAVSVEAVLVLPVVIFALLAMFVYFDAFRTQKSNTGVSYTVSDLVSRQITPITPAFVENMHDLFDYLARARHPTTLRLSSVYYNVVDQEYQVVWSYASRGGTGLSNAELNAAIDRMPMIPRGDTVVLLETQMNYRPPFNAGLGASVLEHFVVTRPRFAPQIAFADPNAGVVQLTPCQQGHVACGW
ncbi:MAG: TadE/TadG family type IV pilus assembly protein [Pararhodobacter sp.]